MKNLKLIIVLFLVTQFNFAQYNRVSGVVIDEFGLPIPEVKVLNKKLNQFVLTDIDGQYSIKANHLDTLAYSNEHMTTQNLIYYTNPIINVKLKRVIENIERVIVQPPRFFPKKIYHKELETIKLIFNDNNYKISFKKNAKKSFKINAKNNLYFIFVPFLITTDSKINYINFQQKYGINYIEQGNYKIEFITNYNKLTFKHLKKKYNQTCLSEIQQDAIGLENFK